MTGRHSLRPTYVDTFASWGRAARRNAAIRRDNGDGYGEQLAMVRATVYDRAVALVRDMGATDAAVQMIREATACYVEQPPLHNFKEGGLSYIAARAWQLCAHHINPELPNVAPDWDQKGL